MKINPDVKYLNALSNPSPLVADKTTSAAPVAAAKQAVVTSPARPSSISGDFDATRVAEIRASISAGSYHVNTEKIADGLLTTVRDLLSTRAP